jgi:TonB family protein
MKLMKFYSTALFIAYLFIAVPVTNAQTQETPQQKIPLVVRKSTGVLQKSAIYRVEPDYPQEAKAQGISGAVVIEVRVDQSGNVVSTTPVSGQQLLVDAAMRALKNWKFAQTKLSGVAVQAFGNVAFYFAADGKVLDAEAIHPTGSELPNAPTVTVRAESAMAVINDKEAKELSQKLQNAYDIPVRTNNPDDLVLEIVKASIRTVKRDEQNYLTNDATSAYVTDYVMQMAIMLHNRTDRKISGVGLKFTNTTEQHIFFAYPNIAEIPAQGIYSVQINFMTVAGNPADLQVEIVGVRFADGTIGGAFPLAPHAAGNAPMPQTILASEGGAFAMKVDTKPRPLNRLRPNYTEQARNNKISGSVRLKVKVGADGLVKKVHVANALPDGLTEEAIRVIKVLQFQPAMAGGTPVDYWILLDVDFNLR